MTKSYYRSEYSDKQWKALIDKATELGCQITYSKYGNNRQHRPGELNNSSDRERRTECAAQENTRRDTGEHRPQSVQPKRRQRIRLLSDYLQATLRQMTIGKNANAVGWVTVAMCIFGLAPRELTSQDCRKTRETNC